MVKPITKETLFMNCMELDFATKVELEHWMATFEEKVWTEDIMKELSKAGLVRRTVAKVWNKQNHRLTSTFEYEDENAYKACQKIIEEKVMPKAWILPNRKIFPKWFYNTYKMYTAVKGAMKKPKKGFSLDLFTHQKLKVISIFKS